MWVTVCDLAVLYSAFLGNSGSQDLKELLKGGCIAFTSNLASDLFNLDAPTLCSLLTISLQFAVWPLIDSVAMINISIVIEVC